MRRDYEKAKDYAERHEVKTVYTQAEEMIENSNIDAIYIATPPDSHKFYALKVANAGKPCCIEKPLTPSYKDSLAIHRAFQDKEVPLFVAYYRRSLPRFNEVKNTLDSGDLGEIRHITWNLSKPANQFDLTGKYNWRTEKKIALGGYFDDLASHGLDLFAYLLGDFDEVKGIRLNQQGLYSSLDAISACWSHRNGVTGSGSWTFGCHNRQDNVEIYGSKGNIKFSIFDEKPLIICNTAGEREVFIKNPDNIQLYHVQNIANQLFSGAPHPSNGLSATHTSWVMDKILGRIND
jgi:predicted dehydrogenase